MPWGIAAGVVGSVAGGLVSDAMSPSTSGGGPSYYVPTGLRTADQTWQNLMSNLSGIYGAQMGITPYANQSLQEGLAANSQYGGAYQSAANQAGAQYGSLANFLNGQAASNIDKQNALFAAGQNVYNMGLDPQNALYNRTVQQLQDQTGATNSMYGLGSSAAGAGVANQALSNFNIDWHNNQLSRAAQGLQALSGAASTGGAYGQLGTAQATAVPGYSLQAGAVPYQTAQSIASTPGQLANTYGSFLNSNVYSPTESLMSQIIPYMNYGQGAQAVPFQTQSNNAQSYGSTLSSALGGLGNQIQNAGGWSNFFGGTSGSFGSGDFSGAFSSNPYYSGAGNSWGFTL